MERFEDTPELFGYGAGAGTCGDIECDFCGAKYNQGNDEKEDCSGDSVTWTRFAGLTCCDCCFAKIEEDVWRRRRDVLPWLARRIKAEEKSVKKDKRFLDSVFNALEKFVGETSPEGY